MGEVYGPKPGRHPSRQDPASSIAAASKKAQSPLRCAVAVSRMYQARREAGRLFGRCERASLKVRPRIAPGPLLSKAPSTLEGMSILAAAFRTSTALRVGINVALTLLIRRVAFVGTAALARPCSHAFFMFRFLARGSAGTDLSPGRANRPAGL